MNGSEQAEVGNEPVCAELPAMAEACLSHSNTAVTRAMTRISLSNPRMADPFLLRDGPFGFWDVPACLCLRFIAARLLI